MTYLSLIAILLMVPAALLLAGAMYVIGPPAWIAVAGTLGVLSISTAIANDRHERSHGEPIAHADMEPWWRVVLPLGIDLLSIVGAMVILVGIAALVAWLAGFVPTVPPVRR